MTNKIIDFAAAQDLRTIAEIEADEAKWNAQRDRVLNVLMACDLDNRNLIQTTLHALFEAMGRSGFTDEQAAHAIIAYVRLRNRGPL